MLDSTWQETVVQLSVFNCPGKSLTCGVHYMIRLKLPSRNKKQICNRYTCSCCDPPPPHCLDICHIPGGRLVGPSLITLTTGSRRQTPSPHTPQPPPPHPFLYPATTNSHTSPLFMNNPGGPTAHRTQLCGGKTPQQKTGSSGRAAQIRKQWLLVSVRRSRRLKLRAKSHIHKSGPISVLLRQIPQLKGFHFGRCLSPQMFGPQKQERGSL